MGWELRVGGDDNWRGRLHGRRPRHLDLIRVLQVRGVDAEAVDGTARSAGANPERPSSVHGQVARGRDVDIVINVDRGGLHHCGLLIRDLVVPTPGPDGTQVLRVRVQIRTPVPRGLLGIGAHLGDFHIIVAADAADRHEQARHVDQRQLVVEDDTGRTDGDHLFEYAADTQGDHGRPLQKSKLGRNHAEGKHAGEDEEERREGTSVLISEGDHAGEDLGWALDRGSNHDERHEHHRSQEEEGGEGIAGGGMAEKEDLSQAPPEAGEEGRRDDEDETDGIEGRLAGDHHDDAHGHGGDDEDEFEGWGFEAEEEGEDEDKGEGGRFTHGQKGERDELERHVPQTNIERRSRSAGYETSEVEELGQEGFGLRSIGRRGGFWP